LRRGAPKVGRTKAGIARIKAPSLPIPRPCNYLRSHLRMEFAPETDPVSLAKWLTRRLDFALNHPDDVPFGKHRSETVGASVSLPEPEAAPG
jgi:hypothetical protein